MMKGRMINEILQLGAAHALYFHQGNWYHHLKRFPGVLIDSGGYLWFETKEKFANSKDIKIKERVNIYGGISSKKGYIKFSAEQLLKIEEEICSTDEEVALRKLRTTNLVLRNIGLAQKLKETYNYRCQICGNQIPIGTNNYYAEVHHIKPLGKPHNGPDVLENMICVCPNCHVLLDYNAIFLSQHSILSKHKIKKEFVDYHNSQLKAKKT
ncbi:hypothetical protein GUA46_07905 [Muricauda sp. HICW]|uniref:HNH nuclease domain-containing protein n=1 Tax=Flagellimonas chongwuensis TaxID=2697365 RepID=A0A850NAK8_9FLAO|nr:HNH endonuclease [Allomuricauda chongwuensis]NVN18261.1 hypothetical protein [Allomuricauda chongwuensis]